jgi:hypothetical protein
MLTNSVASIFCLGALIKYVEQGRVLETQADAPYNVREQLYAERTSDWAKKKKSAENATMGSICSPINKTVLPVGSSYQSIHPPANLAIPTGPGCTESIMVDGLLVVIVDEYTE